MFLIIDRFLLSRLESLSAAPTSLSFLRFRSKSSKSSEGGQRRDCVRRVCLPPLVTSTTDSPTLASRLVGQCFYSDAGASGGKTLISRLNLIPPPPAAPYGLAPYGICRQFPHLPCRRENRPQTPQVKEDTYARMWVLSSYSITRPEGHIGGINLYVMIEAFRTSRIVFLKPFQDPSELPLCLRLIKYIDTLYLYPFRQGVFP